MELQVNGSSNPLIQAVTFENFPIRKAQFSGGGDEVYVTSGLMSHFHCYDMRSGKTRQVKPNQLNKHETVRVSGEERGFRNIFGWGKVATLQFVFYLF